MCAVLADRETRAAWDAVASSYAQLVPDLQVEAPIDRAVLNAFIEMVKQRGGGVVVDVGCGAGRVAAHLVDAGIRVFGVDVAPRMAATARATRPDIDFLAADAGLLPIRSAAVVGVVAWYSLINTSNELVVEVLREFARVTQPGAPAVIAFQAGDGDRVDRPSAYGHAVPLTYYRHRIADVADALAAAGFVVHTTVRRDARQSHETTPQGFLIAERL